MAALVGRKVIIKKGSSSPKETLAAGRTKTISINKEPVDITSDDDNGVRSLLSTDAAVRSIDLSFEGVTKDDTLLADALSGVNNVDSYEIDIDGIGTISGSFFLTSVQINAPYNDATTFTAELQSTGSFTYTPEA